MNDNNASVQDIVAQLKILTDKLNSASGENDRRALLRLFRALLDQADQALITTKSMRVND